MAAFDKLGRGCFRVHSWARDAQFSLHLVTASFPQLLHEPVGVPVGGNPIVKDLANASSCSPTSILESTLLHPFPAEF